MEDEAAEHNSHTAKLENDASAVKADLESLRQSCLGQGNIDRSLRDDLLSLTNGVSRMDRRLNAQLRGTTRYGNSNKSVKLE